MLNRCLLMYLCRRFASILTLLNKGGDDGKGNLQALDADDRSRASLRNVSYSHSKPSALSNAFRLYLYSNNMI